jgi:SagB-type dehydrogenase family enzyme
MTKKLAILLVIICVFFWGVSSGRTQQLKPIPLIKPQMDSGRLLMNVLKERKTSRDFSDKKLPIRVLSNLLWSACGINRPGSGKRTAPTTMNWQEIDVYVATVQGLYVYDAQQHRLDPLLAQDIRALTGTQTFVSDAPVNLIYVADLTRMGSTSQESKDFYAAVDTGFIAQNVNLYCASEGLATTVIGIINRDKLSHAMKLRPEQKIILTQAVGYPRR